MTTKLIYIGNGAAIIGVPARDLTEQDFMERELNEADLLQGGLYKKPETEPTPKKSKGAKESE